MNSPANDSGGNDLPPSQRTSPSSADVQSGAPPRIGVHRGFCTFTRIADAASVHRVVTRGPLAITTIEFFSAMGDQFQNIPFSPLAGSLRCGVCFFKTGFNQFFEAGLQGTDVVAFPCQEFCTLKSPPAGSTMNVNGPVHRELA